MRVTEKIKTAEAGAAGSCQRGRKSCSSPSTYPNAAVPPCIAFSGSLGRLWVMMGNDGTSKEADSTAEGH